MRPSKKLRIPSASLLLLICILHMAPRAAAQVSCVVTYNCRSSQCAAAVGGPRTLTYPDQKACDAAAKTVGDGTIASCSCGPPAGPAAGAAAAATPAAPGHEFDNTIHQAVAAGVAGKVSPGNAMGLIGLGLLGNALFAPKTTNPVQPEAQQQVNLAAQQLNNSGLYLFRQKNYAGAINEFQQALAQTPNDANIINNLALAKQQLNVQQLNVKAAEQTSGMLGQVLGNAPANAGNLDFDQLTHLSVANPNTSPLNLVDLASDEGVAHLRSATKTSAEPDSLKSQLDAVLANSASVSAPPDSQVVPPQVQDIELLFQPPQSTSPQSQMDVAQKQLEDIFKDPGKTTDSAALAQQARLGQRATAAKSDEDASGLTRQGFDAATPNIVVMQPRTAQALAGTAPASIPSTAVDLNQLTQPLEPEDLKTSQASRAELQTTIVQYAADVKGFNDDVAAAIATRKPQPVQETIPATPTTCTQGANAASAYFDLKQRVQTDQQIIRNFGFEQRADEIQAWADLGEQARKSYQEKARVFLMDLALDNIVGGLQAGVSSAPAISQELSNRLVSMFRAAGLPNDDVAFHIAKKVGETLTPEQADILAGRIENVKHAYDRTKDLKDLANSEGGIELARSVVAVAGWRNPNFALLAKDLDTVSLAIYATRYEKAKYQINKLTQLTETQLTELNDFTLRLRNDTAQLDDTVKALKSLPSCDSTTMILK
ncbi:MAG TPA: tetratricopeptide repeat protein [Terriglobales bacterium]|jgi:tetratricopeptide (TPR) repeat protein|nr:tetratricopeptide repeat protein [Terriglobales bacterium]